MAIAVQYIWDRHLYIYILRSMVLHGAPDSHPRVRVIVPIVSAVSTFGKVHWFTARKLRVDNCCVCSCPLFRTMLSIAVVPVHGVHLNLAHVYMVVPVTSSRLRTHVSIHEAELAADRESGTLMGCCGRTSSR